MKIYLVSQSAMSITLMSSKESLAGHVLKCFAMFDDAFWRHAYSPKSRIFRFWGIKQKVVVRFRSKTSAFALFFANKKTDRSPSIFVCFVLYQNRATASSVPNATVLPLTLTYLLAFSESAIFSLIPFANESSLVEMTRTPLKPLLANKAY